MAIMQVMDDTCQCAVGLVDVRLALNLEVFSIQRLKEFLIEDFFCVHHLTLLVQLGRMLLDLPWDLR